MVATNLIFGVLLPAGVKGVFRLCEVKPWAEVVLDVEVLAVEGIVAVDDSDRLDVLVVDVVRVDKRVPRVVDSSEVVGGLQGRDPEVHDREERVNKGRERCEHAVLRNNPRQLEIVVAVVPGKILARAKPDPLSKVLADCEPHPELPEIAHVPDERAGLGAVEVERRRGIAVVVALAVVDLNVPDAVVLRRVAVEERQPPLTYQRKRAAIHRNVWHH